jgi:hypothetical protein
VRFSRSAFIFLIIVILGAAPLDAQTPQPTFFRIYHLVDVACGSGTVVTMRDLALKRDAAAQASDYPQIIALAHRTIETSALCANNLKRCIQGQICDDAPWVFVESDVLFAQQDLGGAIIPSGGSSSTAAAVLQNQFAVTIKMCSSPNIMLSSEPYTSARTQMTWTLTTARKLKRFSGSPVDDYIDDLRACASKLDFAGL